MSFCGKILNTAMNEGRSWRTEPKPSYSSSRGNKSTGMRGRRPFDSRARSLDKLNGGKNGNDFIGNRHRVDEHRNFSHGRPQEELNRNFGGRKSYRDSANYHFSKRESYQEKSSHMSHKMPSIPVALNSSITPEVYTDIKKSLQHYNLVDGVNIQEVINRSLAFWEKFPSETARVHKLLQVST